MLADATTAAESVDLPMPLRTDAPDRGPGRRADDRAGDQRSTRVGDAAGAAAPREESCSRRSPRWWVRGLGELPPRKRLPWSSSEPWHRPGRRGPGHSVPV
jgi:hypothetical protein